MAARVGSAKESDLHVVRTEEQAQRKPCEANGADAVKAESGENRNSEWGFGLCS